MALYPKGTVVVVVTLVLTVEAKVIKEVAGRRNPPAKPKPLADIPPKVVITGMINYLNCD